jgi:hypothetical protein
MKQNLWQFVSLENRSFAVFHDGNLLFDAISEERAEGHL